MAFADASVRELGVSEFVDNDLYSNFEVRLSHLNPHFLHAKHQLMYDHSHCLYNSVSKNALFKPMNRIRISKMPNYGV